MNKLLQSGHFAISAWLLFLLACVLVVIRTQFTTDLSAFLPKTPTAEQQLLMDQIKDGLASRLILVGIEGSDANTRSQLSKLTAKRLRPDPAFIAVNNGESIYTENDQTFLFKNRYLLSPSVTKDRFTKQGLRDAISESISLLASPAGLMIKAMLPQDPTGEMLQLLTQLNQEQQPNLNNGVWVSKNGERALMLIQTKALGSDTDAQQHAILKIQQAFNSAKDELLKATAQQLNAEMIMTGPSVFTVNARETIKNQVFLLSITGILLISTLLLLVYRSFTALLLGLLPVLTGALAGIATVSISFGMIHGITLGFGTALIGEAIDYSIYLFVQSESDQANQQVWIKRFWPTIRLGVMTSICGFASLLFSGFPGLAQLGLYAISGLLTAAIVTRFVLPYLLPNSFRIHDISAVGNYLSKKVNQAHLLHRPAIVVLIFACLIVFSQRYEIWSKNIASLSPVSQADIALDTQLRKDVGAPDVRYMVVVTADTQEAALQASEQISALLQLQVEQGNIANYESPSRYLPSKQTQQARQDSIPSSASLSKNLSEALIDLPIQANKLEPFIRDALRAKKQSLLGTNDLKDTSMAIAIEGLLINQGLKWNALLPLTARKDKEINASQIRQSFASVKFNNVVLVDMKTESNKLYAGYMQEAINYSLIGLAMIIALLLIVFKSISQLLRVIAPLAAAVLCVTAGLLILGHQLIILHLVGLLLVVAVGSNYALLFNQSNTSPRILASMLFANLTTVIGFGVLAFSDVSILQALGMTVAPGVILALLFSIIFAKKHDV